METFEFKRALQFTGPTCDCEEFTCDSYCLNGNAPFFLRNGTGYCECRPGTGGDR